MKYIYSIIFLLLMTSVSSAQEFSCINELSITPNRLSHPNLDQSGPYFPEEEVEFCVKIDFKISPIGEGNNCQWIQGIIPSLGEGWDFQLSGLDVQGPDGAEWLEEDMVDYNSLNQNFGVIMGCDGIKKLSHEADELMPGEFLPGGWWYVSPGGNGCANDGSPNNMWGLPGTCGSSSFVDFCFRLKVKTMADINNDECFRDLGVDIYTFADGETGCWINVVCGSDPPVLFDAAVIFEEETVSSTRLKNTSLVLQPNYTQDYITLQSIEGFDLSIELINAEGEIVNRISTTTNQNIDLSSFATGLYFLKAFDADGDILLIEKLTKF